MAKRTSPRKSKVAKKSPPGKSAGKSAGGAGRPKTIPLERPAKQAVSPGKPDLFQLRSQYFTKPTRLEIYRKPKQVLNDLRHFFPVERRKFIEAKKNDPPPVFMDERVELAMADELRDIWKLAKVQGTKHPDIATLNLQKVSEDIIDSFDKIKNEKDISQRFTKAWTQMKEEPYFDAYAEFEEAFKELLELGCDESLLDYEGREINVEWIHLAEKVVIGLLASGVIPGKDKHIFLRIPKLEPISFDNIPGIDDQDVERLRLWFRNSPRFPSKEDYAWQIGNRRIEKNRVEIDMRLAKYEKIRRYIIDILHTVAITNLEVCLALDDLKKNSPKDLQITIDRLPIYELSIPQINDPADIDILVKTLREYMEVLTVMKKIDEKRRKYGPKYERYAEKLKQIRIVPLVEHPALMTDLSSFICEYYEQLLQLRAEDDIGTDFTVVDFGEHPHRLLRIWLARSDTALNYGNVAAEIARVFALSECERAKEKLAEKYKEDAPRILLLYGVGLPSFRGGLNPKDRIVWKHYPVAVTLQGVRFDSDEITVMEFAKNAKLFPYHPLLKPLLKKEVFGDDQNEPVRSLVDLLGGKHSTDAASNWTEYFEKKDEWYSHLRLNPADERALKSIMVESICIYWKNISRLGTLIRYMDEVTAKQRSRLKTSAYTRENPTINPDNFKGLLEAEVEKLQEASQKLNKEWPPDKEPLMLSRAIKLNYFLTNCGIPPTLLDAEVFPKLEIEDIDLLKKHVPGLARLVKNDYKLFVPDAAEILLNTEFLSEIKEFTEEALMVLGESPNSWTEAESNFKDVLLGDVISYNALLLVAIATYKDKEIPVGHFELTKSEDPFFIDMLSRENLDESYTELMVKHRLVSFADRYPENILEALEYLRRFQGDQRWLKVIYAGAKLALARGWVG